MVMVTGSRLVPRLTDAFQSRCLEYIKPEPQNKTFRAFIEQYLLDLDLQGMAGAQLVRPVSQLDVDSHIAKIANSLLGVAICLAPGELLRDERQEGAKVAGDTVSGIDAMIGFLCISHPTQEIFGPSRHRNGTIFLAFAPEYQSIGYGSEALSWALKWSFDRADLHTLHGHIPAYNYKGMKLFKRMGFTVEGWRKETIWQDGFFHDLVEFGMTVRSWLKDSERESPRSPINMN